MQVNANVSESDIGQVTEGQPANFRVDAYPKLFFEGRVTQVRNAPISIQNVVTYDVVITVDNRELKLKPGMTANVTIVTEKKKRTRSACRTGPYASEPGGAQGDAGLGHGSGRAGPKQSGHHRHRRSFFTEIVDGT